MRELEITHRGHSVSLVTVARLRQEDVIQLAEPPDEELAELIEVASWDVAGPYGIQREPWVQGYRETAVANRDGSLWLSRWPVIRVDRLLDVSGDEIEGYSICGPARNRISGLSPRGRYTVEYSAGWIPADLFVTWEPGLAVEPGRWILAGELAAEAVAGGTNGSTTGSTEPTWPAAAGDTVSDGDVSWRMAVADLAPQNLRRAVVVHVKEMALGLKDVPFGVVREGDDGGYTVYERPTSPFSAYCAAVVRGFR